MRGGARLQRLWQRTRHVRASDHASRSIGDKGVPPEYGQPQEGGTSFLGTPANHAELLQQRPLSPDVFGLDGESHYKFPIVALSSITNRITGATLSSGFATAGAIALVADLPSTVEAIKAAGPAATIPLKFCLSFPFTYHTLAGLRHIVSTCLVFPENDLTTLAIHCSCLVSSLQRT